jgi:hypothetical protein
MTISARWYAIRMASPNLSTVLDTPAGWPRIGLNGLGNYALITQKQPNKG